MGKKGDKQTTLSEQVALALVQTFDPIGSISMKRMFGGFGIFCQNKMFCMVDSSGKSFLKADNKLKSLFEDMGAEKHNRMPYYSLPEAISKDPEKLRSWAKKSIEVALGK